MTDTNTVQTDTPAGASSAPSTSQIVSINVTKAKANIDVNLKELPDNIYEAALKEGVKVMVNGGMSKITAKDIPDEDQRKAEALRIAKARVQEMYEGKLKLGRASTAAKGIPAAVMTEARRLARDTIKAEIKASGGKVSHYKASDITAAANELLKDEKAGPMYIGQAEANLASRGKLPGASSDAISSIKPDPKLVAEAEKKTKKDLPLSAKQAGMTAARAQAATAH